MWAFEYVFGDIFETLNKVGDPFLFLGPDCRVGFESGCWCDRLAEVGAKTYISGDAHFFGVSVSSVFLHVSRLSLRLSRR